MNYVKKRKPPTRIDKDDPVARQLSFTLQAFIVALLKERRTMTEGEIGAEIVNKFGKEIEFKSIITTLIEREYIERSKDKKGVLHYVP